MSYCMTKAKNMKGVTIVIVAALLLLAPSIGAQERSGVGLGIMLGQPSGISAITWLGGGNAVDLVAAWAFTGGGSFYLHADYQFHTYVDRPMSAFAGVGGFVVLRDDPTIGFRIPVGVTFLLRELPMDFFLEIAPAMSLLPSTDFDLFGGLGFRFYF